ncbi:MAG: AMP-binding protein [Candidatus Uhrbacteria bacterium]|nr:AMP-binding protein [Candidatus Uhrbacteria bacterium]
MNAIHDYLEVNARRIPEKTAIIYKDEKLSYKELNDQCNQCAHALAVLGVVKGDRVVISTKNKLLEVIFCFGILKVGAVEVAIDAYDFVIAEDAIAQKTNARLIVTDKPIGGRINVITPSRELFFAFDKIPLSVPITPDDIAFIQHTSGSTGLPMGIALSHRNFLIPLELNEYIVRRGQDILFFQMPLAYAYGKSILLEYIAAGATIHLVDKIILPQESFNFFKLNSISATEGPPSFYEMLLRFSNFKKEPLENLTYISIGGGAATERLVKELRNAQPQATISNRYGMTETASVVTRVEFGQNSNPSKFGTCGIEAPYVKVKIVDDSGVEVSRGGSGELIVSGENISLGYITEGMGLKQITQDGWLNTGDIGRMDEDGYFYILSRKSQIIKSQGYRISPALIEEVLLRISGVESVVVVGVAHEIYGEIVKAFIVKNKGPLTESEVISFCSTRLSSFMLPRAIQFIDEMPLTFSGKIDKKRLPA